MPTRRLAVLLALAALSPPALAADPVDIASTAIVVPPFHEGQVVLGDDGNNHVEYDLLVTNVFTGRVTLTPVEVIDPAGKRPHAPRRRGARGGDADAHRRRAGQRDPSIQRRGA